MTDAQIMFSKIFKFFLLLSALFLLGCQMQHAGVNGSDHGDAAGEIMHRIYAPEPWGGDVRCGVHGCLLGVVEHENNILALHKIENKSSALLAKYPVGYHPDSAFWINDDYLVVAVEFSQSLDIFRIRGNNLELERQIFFNFRPRNGLSIKNQDGTFTILAVPYNGKNIGWFKFDPAKSSDQIVSEVALCEAPWHPVPISSYLGNQKTAIVVACRGEGTIMIFSPMGGKADSRTIATFKDVPRQVKPSPDGEWLYVALEVNGSNARINMKNGSVQRLSIPGNGSYSVGPLKDQTVAWGGSGKVYLQKIGENGEIQAQKILKSSGFSSDLKVYDLNNDDFEDLIIFNSVNQHVDVIYGPLWSAAQND